MYFDEAASILHVFVLFKKYTCFSTLILWRLQEVSKHKHTNRQLIFQMEQKQNMKHRRIREKYFIDKWIGNYPGAKWRLELMLSLRLLIVDIVEYFILTNLHPKLLFAVRRSQVPRTRLNYKKCAAPVLVTTHWYDHISGAMYVSASDWDLGSQRNI